MKQLNIYELYRNSNIKKEKRKECFEKILDICHQRIIKYSKNYFVFTLNVLFLYNLKTIY